jgi:ribonucleoside-diphosphate reductase beta chain
LCSSQQIEEAHQWVVDNEALQQRAKELIPYYISDDPLESKIAAALMPGFLLYGGFYLPFYLSARGKLPNTSDIIRLILRDKVIHNYYSGYKFQRKVEKLNSEKQNQIKNFVFDLMYRLIDLEKKYLKELYAGFDIADDAIRFSTYNAGKFLQNLGYDSPFTEAETKIAPEIFNQLSARADENHDFFSGNGSSYVMGTYEETKDEDWDF